MALQVSFDNNSTNRRDQVSLTYLVFQQLYLCLYLVGIRLCNLCLRGFAIPAGTRL